MSTGQAIAPASTQPAGTRSRGLVVTAAVLQLAQGVLMEGAVFVGGVAMLLLGIDPGDYARYFSFALPFLQENLAQLMLLSGVFTALRIAASIGLLRDRVWGVSLTVIMCVVTLVLMTFMLPAGIADGVLSGGALVLVLLAWHGTARISQRG